MCIRDSTHTHTHTCDMTFTHARAHTRSRKLFWRRRHTILPMSVLLRSIRRTTWRVLFHLSHHRGTGQDKGQITTRAKYALAFSSLFLNYARVPAPPGGKLQTQELKAHLLRAQSLKVLPLKPGVGQYIARHATPAARGFLLAIRSHSQ